MSRKQFIENILWTDESYFFLWGHFKNFVYATPINNIEELMERIIIILKYSERQKYGINSLKIKQNLLDRSILVYKNTYFNTK
jgi:hypothetical protein